MNALVQLLERERLALQVASLDDAVDEFFWESDTLYFGEAKSKPVLARRIEFELRRDIVLLYEEDSVTFLAWLR